MTGDVMQKKIPFFNYSALFKKNENEIMDVIRDVLNRGAFILQKDLEEFETGIKNFLNVRHAFGVADGTNALILALRAVGIGAGDEVILCSHTYVATAASVHFAGATPILVECGTDHMIDAEGVRKAVSPRTKAIVPTQLNGRTANMDALQAIADQHQLLIVEDAAQALGSRYKGRHAGTFGCAGTFSFYPAKLLGCFGDGGAVVTNDDAVAEKIFLYRDHGRNKSGDVVTWGTNCRLDNLQAAVLDWKLKTFKKEIERRREIAGAYHGALKDIEDIVLPPPPVKDADHFDVYQNYEIESGRRDELKSYLAAHGIGTIIQWGGKAVHQLQGLGFENVHLPITEKMTSRFLMLPMHTALSNDDVHYICQAVRRFYGRTA